MRLLRRKSWAIPKVEVNPTRARLIWTLSLNFDLVIKIDEELRREARLGSIAD
jgi:hypothetical protein